jgi:hypothetical protein
MSATTKPSRNNPSGWLILFGLVFTVPGIAVGVSTVRKIVSGAADAKQIVLGLTLAVLFVVAGIGLMVWGRVAGRIAARNTARMAEHPNEPWLWRGDWAQGYARSEWKPTAGMMIVMGLVFLLFSVPMLMNFPGGHPFRAIFVSVFPVTGFLLVGLSTVAQLRARKFKNVCFKLSGVPCVIGGKLQGRLEVEFVFPAGTTVDFSVNCVRSYVTGRGDNRTRWERILWQERKTVTVETDGLTSYARIEVTLPYDAKETDSRNPDDEILWKVITSSKLPGLDFNAIFILPVFRTAASDPGLTTAAIEESDEKLLDGQRPENKKIVTGTAPDGGLLFYFGPSRNVRAATLISLFGAIFLGSGLFFGFAAGQTFSWILGMIPITFAGGIGLLLMAYGVWLFLGTTTVEVLGRELHTRSTCLGIGRSRVIPASAIQDFKLHPGLQTGEQVWYDLRLKLVDGRSCTAGSGLEKKEAEWLRLELKKALGISQ